MGGFRVLYFATARGASGVAEEWMEMSEGTLSAEDLWTELLRRHPKLGPLRAAVRLARNREYLGEGELFAAGDEIAVIPPVSGG